MTRLIWLLAVVPAAAGRRAAVRGARAKFVVDAWAHPKGRRAAQLCQIAARLKLHEDAALCSRRLEELLAEGPTGDMFWMFPITAIAYLDQGQLSDSARQALRRSFRTYMPYRGDTENHWLLYYTSMYLMAQLWPDQPGDQWFTGKSSAENLREAAGWIESWVKLTTTRGQGEYDSPHYMGLYFLSMSYLAEWAHDPVMKKRAAMMLDYLIADFAAESLDGVFVGAHSRVYDRPVVEKWNNVSSDFGWVLFGQGYTADLPANYLLYYVLASAYEPPEILQRIATDRDHPYTHYERKRTRNRWRFFDELHGPVYKTTYMRREYAVSSDQGGTLQPIQEHSWDVTWNVPDPRGVQNTLFTLHPVFLAARVTDLLHLSARPGCRRSRQLEEELRFARQIRGRLAVRADLPGSGHGDRALRHPGRHSLSAHQRLLLEGPRRGSRGSFRVGSLPAAATPTSPAARCSRIVGGRSKAEAGACSVPISRTGWWCRWRRDRSSRIWTPSSDAILALPLDYKLAPVPTVRFTSLRGKTLAFTYGQTPRVNGTPLDYAKWPLFGGPFVEAAVDSEQLILKYGKLRRTLDFRKLTVSDDSSGK